MIQIHLAKKFAVFLIVAVFLSACTLQKQGSAIITEDQLRTGTDSLSVNFLNSMPPAKIFSADKDFPDSGLFEVGFNIENKGAADIISGVLALSLETGYVNDIKSKWKSSDERFNERSADNSVTFQLTGKTTENPLGDKIIFSKILQAKIPDSDKESQTRKSTIIATACYDYKTRKTASVCIDPMPFSEKIGPRPCEVKEMTFESQGAPLAVTKISPTMVSTGGRTTAEFLIYIKNKGNGQIIPSNKILAACEPTGGDKNFWNTINQEDFKIQFSTGESSFKCGPFPLKLSKDQEDFIRCIYQGAITGNQPYSTTLNLEFNYGYTFSVSKDITIERPPKIAP